MNFTRWRPLPSMQPGAEDSFFRPQVHRRLQVRRQEKIFAIGSCFARNIEAFLTPYFQVLSRVPIEAVPSDIRAMDPELTANRVIWHRYNAFSIYNSLRWAVAPDFERHRLMKVAGDCYVDAYAGSRTILKRHDAERVQSWIDETIANVRDCRVIIITLGLSEIWKDHETGLVMNCSPLIEMWQSYPDRFSPAVASHAGTLEQLSKIHALLSEHCCEDFQIVVTVSPIPLAATFREMDIAVANAASKSILRAAVDEWAGRHDNVHYFPSYEMMLNSNPANVWCDDFRHCSVESIKQVMDFFVREFIELEPN